MRTQGNHLPFNGLFLLIASFVLIGWMIYLVFSLPNSYRARHWDLAWVGFDCGMAVRRSIQNAHEMAGAEVITVSLWRTPLMIFDRE